MLLLFYMHYWCLLYTRLDISLDIRLYIGLYIGCMGRLTNTRSGSNSIPRIMRRSNRTISSMRSRILVSIRIISGILMCTIINILLWILSIFIYTQWCHIIIIIHTTAIYIVIYTMWLCSIVHLCLICLIIWYFTIF